MAAHTRYTQHIDRTPQVLRTHHCYHSHTRGRIAVYNTVCTSLRPTIASTLNTIRHHIRHHNAHHHRSRYYYVCHVALFLVISS